MPRWPRCCTAWNPKGSSPATVVIWHLFTNRRFPPRQFASAVDRNAVKAGRELFMHRFTANDSLTGGDGLGPVFNASSCVECHMQAGPGGGGPVSRNVTVYGLVEPHPRGLPQSGVVHQKAIAPAFEETLILVHASVPSSRSIPPSTLTDGT